VDIRELFSRPEDASNEAIINMLADAGAYYDLPCRAMVIPGDDLHNPFLVTLTDKQSLRFFAMYVWQHTGLSPKSFNIDDALQFILQLYKVWPPEMPKVLFMGNRPQLFKNSKGELYFPTIDSPRSRLVPVNQTVSSAHYMKYTGPPLVPRDHGGLFEKFLATLKCADEDNRAVFRTFFYGAMIAGLVPPGHYPALLIAADDHSAGKTTTADMIAHILGGGLPIVWEAVSGEEDLNRRAMDPSYACIIIDNLRNKGGKLIDDSYLASLITTKLLTVKALYQATGSVKLPNYLKIIMTANQPLFASELLSRVLVGTLLRDAEGSDGWVDDWEPRRVELLEDLMWHVQQNWKKGPYKCPCGTRFDTWHALTARALQAPPMLIPKVTAVTSPLELALDLVWPGDERVVSLALIERLIKESTVGVVQNIARQRNWTQEALVEDLTRYIRKYKVEDGMVARMEVYNETN
jgi:hypothetical protein